MPLAGTCLDTPPRGQLLPMNVLRTDVPLLTKEGPGVVLFVALQRYYIEGILGGASKGEVSRA